MNNTNINTRPELSFWQIWNMCFGFLGIQFGFALQNANVPRIFQTLGAEVEDLPILFLAAPVTGLILQPLIGYFSDKTWMRRLGRRRPYFLVGAILATLALFVMPNSTALWFTVILLWLLNSSINIAMEPFRSFVCDMLPNEQRTKGFAMQAFFIGVGSVIASALPWIFTNIFNVSNTAPAGQIPDSVIYSFYVGGLAFISAVLVTVISTKEYSPELLAIYDKTDNDAKAIEKENTHVVNSVIKGEYSFLLQGIAWLFLGSISSLFVYRLALDHNLYVLTVGLCAYGVLLLITSYLQRKNKTDNGLFEVMTDLITMPKAMQQLSLVQFFSWFSLFSLWIYITPAVTSFHYHTSDTTSALYNEGANWVGLLFATYNGVSVLAAIAIPFMVRKTSRKITHMINLSLGGIGLILFYFIKDPLYLTIPMIGVGFAWASILSMPYAILASSLPGNKAGIYMGIFNLFITIPQILAATILGLMVHELFSDQTILALVAGGISMILAAVSTLIVQDKKD
jgi:maltose/moltooligosaccharide transporter